MGASAAPFDADDDLATVKLSVFVVLVRPGAAVAPDFPVEEAPFDHVVGPTKK